MQRTSWARRNRVSNLASAAPQQSTVHRCAGQREKRAQNKKRPASGRAFRLDMTIEQSLNAFD
ncbi:MAG: hypothetical protein EAZ30_00710 [Betaproteobacteria bacterium]|nr:MAG: hypothetical protein EAZ43_14095 [Betaproteobacteria bacterium]TAG50251.1 MAG: hypothetical protein EAZ30_00710 [Betaproteobacteria bacterium]